MTLLSAKNVTLAKISWLGKGNLLYRMSSIEYLEESEVRSKGYYKYRLEYISRFIFIIV